MFPLTGAAGRCVAFAVGGVLRHRAVWAEDGAHGKGAGYLSVAAIVTSCVLSMVAMFGVWLPAHPLTDAAHHGAEHEAGADHEGESENPESGEAEEHGALDVDGAQLTLTAFPAVEAESKAAAEDEAAEHAANETPPYYAADWYELGRWDNLARGNLKPASIKLSIGYYIDALTVTMFCMVTLIASCVHIYALGYMHDELHEPYVDHEVHSIKRRAPQRKGRFYRFFQYLSLFSFSMLGLVIAGNMAMVFVFWELVGICSYFLIGFYIERKSASTAANKAFIVNRVGDFGMLIGMMALWSSLGTFNFGDVKNDKGEVVEKGIFSQLRTEENDYQIAADAEHDRRGAASRHDDRRAGSRRPGTSKPSSTDRGARPGTCCCSSPAWASSAVAWAKAPNSRCTRGCPTRWRGRRRFLRSCTRRRWSPRACTWSAGSIRHFRPKRCSSLPSSA